MPDPLGALTDDDRAWLDRMADVLPDGWVVDGTDAWVVYELAGITPPGPRARSAGAMVSAWTGPASWPSSFSRGA